MAKPIPASPWQETLPNELPLHFRRNVELGDGGCWLWLRSKSSDGYGWASLNDRTYQAHRLAYQLVKGEVPKGMHLDHLCRIRHCVNPYHLEPVTPRENLRRGDTPTAWDKCQRCGGEYSWIGQTKPQRRCKPCAYEQATKRRRSLGVKERKKREV